MKKTKILILSITLTLLSPSFIGVMSANYDPIFTLNLVTINTSSARVEWATHFENQLPQIGIEVGEHYMGGWGDAFGRFESYEGTYEEGGFDVFFWGLSSGFEWSQYDWFLSTSSDNEYSYDNPTYDNLVDQYIAEPNGTERIEIFQDIQNELYRDLPAIGIITPGQSYGKQNNVTGIDFDLLSYHVQRTENWIDENDSVIIYATPADMSEENFYRGASHYDLLWMQSIYGGLFGREQYTHHWQPIIAKNYSISGDDRVITVDLDTKARFSDGTPVLAEDVIYSYDLHVDPDVDSPWNSFISTNLESWLEIDSDTIEFTFFEPTMNAFELLSIGIILIVS